MQLVQEEDDVPRAPHLGEDIFDPLFKFAPVFGARHHGREVQGHKALVPQVLRYGAGGDGQSQSLGHGGLAHPRLADEGGIVFPAAGEDLHHPGHLLFPANHRVQLPG